MSRPCDAEALDALAAGELGPAEAAQVQGHADRCPRCRHELAWLKTESALFEQRALRQATGAWTNEGRLRTKPPAEGPGPYWARWAVAAGLLLLAAGGRTGPMSRPVESAREAEEISDSALQASVDPQELIASLERQAGACLLATPGIGLACSPAPEVEASFGLAGN